LFFLVLWQELKIHQFDLCLVFFVNDQCEKELLGLAGEMDLPAVSSL
jgi:hypothetical protein